MKKPPAPVYDLVDIKHSEIENANVEILPNLYFTSKINDELGLTIQIRYAGVYFLQQLSSVMMMLEFGNNSIFRSETLTTLQFHFSLNLVINSSNFNTYQLFVSASCVDKHSYLYML